MRLITFNVLGCRGFPLEPGKAVVFNAVSGELCAALAAWIRKQGADIILLQEAPPEEWVRAIADQAGMNCAFFPPQMVPGGDWPFGFPGAILSRHPVAEAEDIATRLRRPGDPRFHRHWGAATITAGGHRVRVSTTHLCADWPGHDGGPTRRAEVEAILAAAPADLFGADCNSRPGEGPWRMLRDSDWRDAWLEAGGPGDGFTSDTRNPVQRIDYIWLAPHSPLRAVRAEVLCDLEVLIAGQPMLLSDHFPIAVDIAFQGSP